MRKEKRKKRKERKGYFSPDVQQEFLEVSVLSN